MRRGGRRASGTAVSNGSCGSLWTSTCGIHHDGLSQLNTSRAQVPLTSRAEEEEEGCVCSLVLLRVDGGGGE